MKSAAGRDGRSEQQTADLEQVDIQEKTNPVNFLYGDLVAADSLPDNQLQGTVSPSPYQSVNYSLSVSQLVIHSVTQLITLLICQSLYQLIPSDNRLRGAVSRSICRTVSHPVSRPL